MPANEETYTWIANGTGTGSSATISFTSIPQTYTDLVIVGSGSNSTQQNNWVYFNNDNTSGRYNWQRMTSNNAANIGAAYSSGTQFYMGSLQPSPDRGQIIIDIMGYSDVTYLYPTVAIRGGAGANGNNHTVLAGTYATLTAVTSIQLFTDSLWNTDTTFSLFGILRA